MISDWTTEWRGLRHRRLGVLPFTRHIPCNRAAKRENTRVGIVLKCVGCGARQVITPDNVHLPITKEFYYWCGVMERPKVRMAL